MRGRRADSPAQTHCRQSLIGNADKAARRHQNVLAFNELLQRDLLLAWRETGRVDQTRIAAFPQHLTTEQALGKAAGSDRQVDAAFHQRAGNDLAVGLAKYQPQLRRTAGDFLDQVAPVGNFKII